jgi:hypothetical protein
MTTFIELEQLGTRCAPYSVYKYTVETDKVGPNKS